MDPGAAGRLIGSDAHREIQNDVLDPHGMPSPMRRQLEKNEPMSWRGNRPVPTGVQAGREIGARSGWGAYCRAAAGHPEHHQSLEVAQGEEKGASKVDKCCQN